MPRTALSLSGPAPLPAGRAALAEGFAAIRVEHELPAAFPQAVLGEAGVAVRDLGRPELDRTDLPLVTLDPPGSRDLDQAMGIERRSGGGFRVWYAIADVAAFVRPGGELDREARRRVLTCYLPDVRVPLHPAELSEDAASLLPGQDRPAVLWCVDVDAHGAPTAVDVRRALVRSRAQLDYPAMELALAESRAPAVIGLLCELGGLLEARQTSRGGMILNVPTQQISSTPDGWRLEYAVERPIERWNAQISLLIGAAAARIMLRGGVGIVRTLPEPSPITVRRLRKAAKGLGVVWPDRRSYQRLVSSLTPDDPHQAALLWEAMALLRGAAYTPFDGTCPAKPKHSALGIAYAHATAPLRRLVDRYTSECCLALTAGRDVPDWVRETLPELPADMERGERLSRTVDRACIDLAEAVLLADRIGEDFTGVVLDLNDRIDWDQNGKPDAGTVMLRDPAVIARLDGHDLPQGTEVRVRLTKVDAVERKVYFDWIDAE
ncbi:RNB domain-containing ribonuclease [Actinospica sp.]|uniref:RNB domain-containing ribonuclease n=1 Tax=Actinospica sp. TaxID=1872142 RepID=UPI002BCFA0A5|nr:RNB domain-containing ribonuclease [Actinospica sp.]HWG25294.1 RNB domain-containing ribonuclease [Actinospica sp.]